MLGDLAGLPLLMSAPCSHCEQIRTRGSDAALAAPICPQCGQTIRVSMSMATAAGNAGASTSEVFHCSAPAVASSSMVRLVTGRRHARTGPALADRSRPPMRHSRRPVPEESLPSETDQRPRQCGMRPPGRLKPLSAIRAHGSIRPGPSRPRSSTPLRLAHHFQVEDRSERDQFCLDPLPVAHRASPRPWDPA
jgi:hypothetical protein